jgi:hypothetical protein
MKIAARFLVCLFFFIVLAGCRIAEMAATVTPIPGVNSAPTTENGSCTDPMAVMKTLYDSNDAGTFDKSLGLLTDDIDFSFWAEGVNGHHMNEQFLKGKSQVRTILNGPGLRRSSGQPNAPIFHEDKVKITGNTVVYMLLPDRVHPGGRPYNPYKVTAIFDGCKIKSLNVVEQVTWL